MAIYMPPLCRKKQVEGRYNPDSFRVISDFAVETHPKYRREHTENISEWRKRWRENDGLALPDIYNRKTEVLPHEAPDYRVNKPHPGSCGFLRHDVRLLNEPICTVFTEVTRDDQQNWWPSRISTESLNVPPKTKDTIYRADFQDREKTFAGFGSQRHTANPNKEPALGTVPVNFLSSRDGRQRLFKEKISYEHQYNSRFGDNYPLRGKRHGSFVWDQMSQDASKKFIDHYKIITAEEGVARQQRMEAEKKFSEPLRKTELVYEPPIVEPTFPKAEPTLPTAGQMAPLDIKVSEPPPQKLSSPKCSPQHSPQQRVSPKGSPDHSTNNSRKNSRGSTNGVQAKSSVKSPPKSPEAGNGPNKLPEEVTVNNSNTIVDSSNSQTIVENQCNTEVTVTS